MAIAIYARKSVERENSISCETQIEYCRAMIKPDEREEEVRVYVDNGSSGGNTDRDGFLRMMKSVEREEIKKVICYRLDRISRSLSDFVLILDTLKKKGVQFVSSQESFDTSTPYGEMIVKLLMVFAEFERKSIIERVTQAYAHRSELGLYMGGRRPYGFSLSETEIHGIKTKKLIQIEREADVVRFIYELYSTDGTSLRDVVREVELKYPLEVWSAPKVATIIRNPIYVRADNLMYEYLLRENVRIISSAEEFDGTCGVQIYGRSKHGKEPHETKAVVMRHEGIVPSYIWLRCREKLEKNKAKGRSVGNTTSWLSGKVYCRSCGGKMRTVRGNIKCDGSSTRYFGCTRRSDHSCTGVGTVYAEDLENSIGGLIFEKLRELSKVEVDVPVTDSDRMNKLKNRISGIKKAESELLKLACRADLEYDLLKLINERAHKLASEEADIKNMIDAEEKRAMSHTKYYDFSEEWTEAGIFEKKSVADILINSVYIDKSGDVEIIWNC